MSRRIAALLAGAVMVAAVGIGASPASAHDLTCSTSQFGHRQDLKNKASLKVDDMPGAKCFVVRKNVIHFAAPQSPGSRYIWHQQVYKISESGTGPFYTSAYYYIGKPWRTHYG